MAAEQKRPDVVRARNSWHRRIARKKPRRLIMQAKEPTLLEVIIAAKLGQNADSEI
jgi:hypothetical protein